jgi:hypothetical protein
MSDEQEKNNKPAKSFSEDLAEFRKVWNEAMNKTEQESEVKWNALSKEDQLDYFCAVTRRIYQAEIVDKGSYRHALYSVFGFGPEAYASAQLAGYLEIHNSIYPGNYDEKLLGQFAEKLGIEDREEKIQDFLIGKR